MTLPKFILFDYGETLFTEQENGWKAGMEAVLARATSNPNGITADEYERLEQELWADMAGQDSECCREMDFSAIQRYIHEYCGLEFAEPLQELEGLLWEISSPCKPTPGIAELLNYLKSKGICTAVISNLCFREKTLTDRINNELPEHSFDFIISTREYGLRKPSHRIFDLALKKAGVAAQDAWFCGNDSVCDVEGSARAGLFPVWYTGARHSQTPPKCAHTEIGAWADMIRLLRKM